LSTCSRYRLDVEGGLVRALRVLGAALEKLIENVLVGCFGALKGGELADGHPGQSPGALELLEGGTDKTVLDHFLSSNLEVTVMKRLLFDGNSGIAH
jgi:hypothetical protein